MKIVRERPSAVTPFTLSQRGINNRTIREHCQADMIKLVYILTYSVVCMARSSWVWCIQYLQCAILKLYHVPNIAVTLLQPSRIGVLIIVFPDRSRMSG